MNKHVNPERTYCMYSCRLNTDHSAEGAQLVLASMGDAKQLVKLKVYCIRRC